MVDGGADASEPAERMILFASPGETAVWCRVVVATLTDSRATQSAWMRLKAGTRAGVAVAISESVSSEPQAQDWAVPAQIAVGPALPEAGQISRQGT